MFLFVAPVYLKSEMVSIPCPEQVDMPTNPKRRKVDQHPDVIDKVKDFIESHGFAAQERRRSDIGNCSGVTLGQIRDHVNQDGITISKSNIHRMLEPPNKRNRASKLYMGYVKARVALKQNNVISNEHRDLHFTCAQVRYANELFQLFEQETTQLSCDDKNSCCIQISSNKENFPYQ